MSAERRLFTRTTVQVSGILRWPQKGFLGRVKTAEVDGQTVDLSVDGTKIMVPSTVDVSIGQGCEIEFHGEATLATVRDIIPGLDGPKMLCLQFYQPTPDFSAVVDRFLSGTARERRTYESNWLGEKNAS